MGWEGTQSGTQCFHRAVFNVVVRDGAKPTSVHGGNSDSLCGQMALELAGVATVGKAKDDDVGGHRLAFRHPRQLLQERFDLGRPLVVISEAFYVVV